MGKTSAGFTLVEVIVALAIAAGALIILLSANNSSLASSTRSRNDAKVHLALESKLDELRAGVETSTGGELAACPSWEWRAERESVAEADDIKHLKRITLVAMNSRSRERVLKTILVYEDPRQKK